MCRNDRIQTKRYFNEWRNYIWHISNNAAHFGGQKFAVASAFSRFRRMQYGQMHKFGNLYLANYANEAAYREDTRRMSNGDIFDDISRKCATTPTSRDWCGYWQDNKRQAERLAA
ncbi:transposase [Herminiimonas sp. CN]|uniref:transposase n=1 Tax=Herminiimonas sp. CN TaxID=1349818 RepID=UPI0004734D73|nr:transposase [Herminiimonas sp. CN]